MSEALRINTFFSLKCFLSFFFYFLFFPVLVLDAVMHDSSFHVAFSQRSGAKQIYNFYNCVEEVGAMVFCGGNGESCDWSL